ncbi:MAG TPA: AcvB/VirJ family lysyl-phosphatidylglycerol hydrolase [Candidatus Binatia bacterium]
MTSRVEGRLGPVRIIAPRGPSAGTLFLFSDANGWTPALDDAARRLAAGGAIVVGVDLATYLENLRSSTDGCHYVVAEIEALSHRLEREMQMESYRTPVLVGVGPGATLAYAALAQAPAVTIAGAGGVDPVPTLATRVPFCPGAPATADPAGGFRYASGIPLPAAWRTIASGGDVARALIDVATPMLVQPRVADAIVAALPELPLTVLSAPNRGPLAAIIYSGDGGWRDLDKTIGEALADRGVPVIGVDSLRYFWHEKTPERVATDLSSIMTAAGAVWGRKWFVLVGYSFGAGVLPFAVNRLSPEDRAQIVEISLLGLEPRAPFEIEVTGILGRAPSATAPLVAPEAQHLEPDLVQCFYGEQDTSTLCRDPILARAELVRTSGSHHFDGNYAALADRILSGAERRLAARQRRGVAVATPVSGG